MPYIGVQPIEKASRVLTQGTLGSATDVINVPGGYQPGNISVHINGMRLQTNEYNATDGSVVTLTQAAGAGTDYIVEEFRSFVISETPPGTVHAPGTGLPNEAGNVVFRDVTTGETDTTSERVLQVGSGGLLSVTAQSSHWGTPFFQRQIGSVSSSGDYILLCDRNNGDHSICGSFVVKRSVNTNTGNHFVKLDVISSSGDVPARRGVYWATAQHSSTSDPVIVEMEWDGRSWIAIRTPEAAVRPFSHSSYFSGMVTEHPDLFRQVPASEVSNVQVAENRGAGGDPVTPVFTRMGLSDYYGGNILGTVSEDDGVPTGAIIERGSNDDGEYVKLADGTVLAFIEAALGSITDNGSGTFSDPYRTSPVDLDTPVTILDGKTYVDAYRPSTTPLRTLNFGVGEALASGEVVRRVVVYRVGSDTTSPDITARIMAVGRWY